MMPTCTLSLTQQVHGQLQRHLFPGDGKEAAAVLVCTRVPGTRLRLLVRDVIAVPHDKCSRRDAVSITWPSARRARGRRCSFMNKSIMRDVECANRRPREICILPRADGARLGWAPRREPRKPIPMARGLRPF